MWNFIKKMVSRKRVVFYQYKIQFEIIYNDPRYLTGKRVSRGTQYHYYKEDENFNGQPFTWRSGNVYEQYTPIAKFTLTKFK